MMKRSGPESCSSTSEPAGAHRQGAAPLPRRVLGRSPRRRAAALAVAADPARDRAAHPPAPFRRGLRLDLAPRGIAARGAERSAPCPHRRCARPPPEFATPPRAGDALRRALDPAPEPRARRSRRTPAAGATALSAVLGHHHRFGLRCGGGEPCAGAGCQSFVSSPATTRSPADQRSPRACGRSWPTTPASPPLFLPRDSGALLPRRRPLLLPLPAHRARARRAPTMARRTPLRGLQFALRARAVASTLHRRAARGPAATRHPRSGRALSWFRGRLPGDAGGNCDPGQRALPRRAAAASAFATSLASTMAHTLRCSLR